MRTSYKEEDVIFLLKDITGLVEPQNTEEREKLIQAGKHYCEMLPIEYVPTEKYMEAYRESLTHYAGIVAKSIGRLCDRILEARGRSVVIVSLARAGTPIGILVKRYLKWKYDLDVPHYSISIIRGRGIDDNAMKYLLSRYEAKDILFLDGWVGKGAILGQLEEALKAYPGVSSELAVVADPAYVTELCGTHEDILIPSSCLNSTISGLVSRTFLRDDIIGPEDFHGAVYYGELEAVDLSYSFIEAIEKEFVRDNGRVEKAAEENNGCKKIQETSCQNMESGAEEVARLAKKFGIPDINRVKPGIGETTRVLLRRVPWKVLIKEESKDDPALEHILRLAAERNVTVEFYPLVHYKACGLIKKMSDV